MRLFVKRLFVIQFVIGLLATASAQALSVEQIRKTSDLTPERFAEFFSDFKFKFHDEVQTPEVFLRSRSGDCDDYATIAADVLESRGYTPRLIAVRMKGETHVICYIEETQSYLDYNCRKDEKKTVSCGTSITEIARSVADSFSKDWIATYEFTYSKKERVKRLVNQIIYPSKNKTA